jgi:hypothetical protein
MLRGAPGDNGARDAPCFLLLEVFSSALRVCVDSHQNHHRTSGTGSVMLIQRRRRQRRLQSMHWSPTLRQMAEFSLPSETVVGRSRHRCPRPKGYAQLVPTQPRASTVVCEVMVQVGTRQTTCRTRASATCTAAFRWRIPCSVSGRTQRMIFTIEWRASVVRCTIMLICNERAKINWATMLSEFRTIVTVE